MANVKLILILQLSCIYLISCRFFICPETSQPPQALGNNNLSLKPITYSGVPINQVLISNEILVNTHKNYADSTKDYLIDAYFCPENFAILKKEELDSIISKLGSNAYSTFTDKNGLDMSEGIYYVTNTKGTGDYNKMFMILKNNAIQFDDLDPASYIYNPSSSQKFHTICKLNIQKLKLFFLKIKETLIMIHN